MCVPEISDSQRKVLSDWRRFLPEGEPDTLDEYLKQHVYRQTSRWMARVLEASGLVQVESGPPLKVLLVAD